MIAILDFGMGNIHSCIKAISLYTKNYIFTADHEVIKNADAIVIPGDGHFSKAMENLQEAGLIDVLNQFTESNKPILGICIGFQILFEDSEESNDKQKIKGLGYLKGNIRKFKGKSFKVPHMGWNKLHNIKKVDLLNGLEKDPFMYFIHSYRPVNTAQEDVVATCCYYDEEFPAVVVKRNIYGTQFHPEKSNKLGLRIISNFVNLVGADNSESNLQRVEI